ENRNVGTTCSKVLWPLPGTPEKKLERKLARKKNLENKKYYISQ
ncbi:1469_t:CDS:1, partial [Gigaspora rosea]